jgi:hypothetical protein
MRALGVLLFALLLSACNNEPTEASVVNDLPGVTIEKVWFRTTLFTEVIETGHASGTLRVGAGTEPAYAIVRINGHAFVARTNDPVDAPAAEQTSIVFSPTTARSLCFGEPRLDAEDQAFITSRIFPGDDIDATAAACAAP